MSNISEIEKELHKQYENIDVENKSLLIEAKAELFSDFLDFISDYGHNLKDNNLQVLDIESKQLYYEPYLDYRDKEAISENLPKIKSGVISGIHEVKRIMAEKLHANDDTPLTISDIKNAATSIIHDKVDEYVESYDLPSPDEYADSYLERKLDDLEAQDTGAMSSEELALHEMMIKLLEDYDTANFLSDCQKATHVDMEYVNLKCDEIYSCINDANIIGYITITTPSEVGNDLYSLQEMLKSYEFSKLLDPTLDVFDGDSIHEKMKERNTLVEDLFNNIDRFDNGLTHQLIQHGLTLDVIADYEKMKNFLEQNQTSRMFAKNVIQDDSEASNYLMTLATPVSMGYREVLTANLIRVLSNAANESYYFQYDNVWNEPVSHYAVFDFNQEKKVYQANDLIKFIPDEIKNGALKMTFNHSGVYSPISGANGLFEMTNATLTIPFTALYVEDCFSSPQIGEYGLAEVSGEPSNPNIINLLIDEDDKLNPEISIQLEDNQLTKNMIRAFNNGLTYNQLEEIHENNLKYVELQEKNKLKNKYGM